jgi:hypothetical protein
MSARFSRHTSYDFVGEDIILPLNYGGNQALPDGDPHVLYVGEVLAAYEL